jgi:hypothetical protein
MEFVFVSFSLVFCGRAKDSDAETSRGRMTHASLPAVSIQSRIPPSSFHSFDIRHASLFQNIPEYILEYETAVETKTACVYMYICNPVVARSSYLLPGHKGKSSVLCLGQTKRGWSCSAESPPKFTTKDIIFIINIIIIIIIVSNNRPQHSPARSLGHHGRLHR